MLTVKTSDGKYTVVQNDQGQVEVLRHGERWLTSDEMIGSKMILTLAQDIEELRSELSKAIDYLRVGKRKFAPNTTNSDVDVFLKKHDQEKF
jgi:hypothetical protein